MQLLLYELPEEVFEGISVRLRAAWNYGHCAGGDLVDFPKVVCFILGGAVNKEWHVSFDQYN